MCQTQFLPPANSPCAQERGQLEDTADTGICQEQGVIVTPGVQSREDKLMEDTDLKAKADII